MIGKDKRYLRALGNRLNSAIEIGKEGINSNFILNLESYLNTHELVKIRILNGDKYYKYDLINVLTENGYEVVGEMGFTLLIYRKNNELKDRIILPSKVDK